jgi:serine/arginine repetitive matrix protein 1
MQINLTGFLEAEAAPFMQALWTLLVSAQNEVGGIPTEILEKKKAELKAQMVNCNTDVLSFRS